MIERRTVTPENHIDPTQIIERHIEMMKKEIMKHVDLPERVQIQQDLTGIRLIWHRSMQAIRSNIKPIVAKKEEIIISIIVKLLHSYLTRLFERIQKNT